MFESNPFITYSKIAMAVKSLEDAATLEIVGSVVVCVGRKVKWQRLPTTFLFSN